MNADKINAIAASAYNTCGPKIGAHATPATVKYFSRTVVANCLSEYVTAHDSDLFTQAEIRAARDAFLGYE